MSTLYYCQKCQKYNPPIDTCPKCGDKILKYEDQDNNKESNLCQTQK